MSIATCNTVNGIMHRLKAVSVADSWTVPGLVPELGEVVIVCEQIVQAILEGDTIVIQDSAYKRILSPGCSSPVCGISQCLIPRRKLKALLVFVSV